MEQLGLEVCVLGRNQKMLQVERGRGFEIPSLPHVIDNTLQIKVVVFEESPSPHLLVDILTQKIGEVGWVSQLHSPQ